MTLFEKIEYMARLGKDSIVVSPDGFKMTVFHWRDADGDFMESDWAKDFSNTKIGYGVPRCTWNGREGSGWKFVGEYPRPEFERFKVGDKVKLIGEDYVYSIASVDDNMAYAVDQVIGYYYGRPVWSLSDKKFHHDQLTPVFEDEEPAEEQEKQEQRTITIDGVEYDLTPKK